MANEKTDIDNADKAEKQIAGYAVSAPRQAELIDKAFKDRKVPLEHIGSLIEGVRKDAQSYRDNVDAAEKTLKAVQKWKSADAASTAKTLERTLKSADKAVSDLERHVTLFDKVWQGCWSAEKTLRADLQSTGTAGQQSLQALQGSKRDMKAQLDELQKQLALARRVQQAAATADGPPSSGSSPAENAASKGLRMVLAQLAATAKDCGAQITTAVSVCSSIDGALKHEDAAYHPEVVRQAADNRQLSQELAKRVGTARALLAQAIAGVKEGKTVLAVFG
jgi:hypothetical protein